MQKALTYQQQDYVHDIRVNDTSTQAVERLSQALEAVYRHSSRHTPCFIRLDLSEHVRLPMRELVKHFRDVQRKYPQRPPAYLALVVDVSMITVLSAVLKTILSRDNVQYFTSPLQAEIWLEMEYEKL